MATTQELLATEAKLRDLRTRAAITRAAKGQSRTFMDALAGLMAQLQATQHAAEVADQQAQAALLDELPPSALDGYGEYSLIDQFLRAERFAGKSASVDFIKANPTCEESEAVAAWEDAAQAVTHLPMVVVPVASYAFLFRANLVKAGLIPTPTWEAQREWIIATDKALIMGA